MTTVRVTIETELGDIEADIFTDAAPITAANFLSYVDRGFYTNGHFYRTVEPDNQPASPVRIEVVQGGIDPARVDERSAPIALERTTVTGLLHTDGTLSMSRFAPDSAHSEIFICIGDQPELDFGGMRNPDGQGFGAFGRVTSGMDVVRAIQQSPHDRQALAPSIAIHRIVRRG
jgi:peptidyl-prolyl cis-trans isomerase A (cyclophilin A)